MMSQAQKIFLAEEAGFCFGVKRAIKLAFEAVSKYKENVYTIGPIIHNPQVVDELEAKGVKVVADLSAVDCGTVIVRSHGIPPELFEIAKKKGLNIVDATCPFVKKAHNYALLLKKEDYQIIIVGDREHPEVRTISSYAGDNTFIIGNKNEIRTLEISTKVGILAQTTQSLENFQEILLELLKKTNELRIFNTICDATIKRQAEARNLAKKVDLMIVIGGYHSANTKRLKEICKETGADTYHIEIAKEIDPEWFVGKQKIGITAGASTPNWVVDKVVKRIRELQ